MLAYAYNNTVEEEIVSSTGKGSTKEKIPKMSEEVKKKLHHMVQAAWPDKNVNTEHSIPSHNLTYNGFNTLSVHIDFKAILFSSYRLVCSLCICCY